MNGSSRDADARASHWDGPPPEDDCPCGLHRKATRWHGANDIVDRRAPAAHLDHSRWRWPPRQQRIAPHPSTRSRQFRCQPATAMKGPAHQ